MVSVKTLEQQLQEAKKVGKNVQNRPSIDLVCVIDNSGSMQGEKLENVKKALITLLDFMNENDRLCLILFNSYGQRLSRLMTCTNKNKKELEQIIKKLFSTGGTDINSGMELAFRTLKQRKYQNPVSSVFLLSDGQDSSAQERVKQSLERILYQETFTLHTFGFGKDHDPTLMNSISSLKDGNFYYVEKVDQVDEFFIDALGALYSIVAKDIKIDINLNIKDQNFQKFFKNCSVSKTYGDFWKCLTKNEHYQISLNQLISGMSKDFVFELTVPAQNVTNIQDFERNVELIKAQIQAVPINPEYTTSVVKNSNLVLTLFTVNEKVAEDSEFHDDVEFNYLRVKAAEAIENAMQEADNQRYDQGQQILGSMIQKLEKVHPQNKLKLAKIAEDLEQCKVNSNANKYYEGKKVMVSKNVCNMKQQSRANDVNDLYCNNRQFALKEQLREMKSKK